MPMIKRFPRCKLEMYSREHGAPHFHLIANDGQRAAYAIETHALLAGGVDVRDRREALAWAKAHTAELMQQWQEFNT